jgi:hypothetical protein
LREGHVDERPNAEPPVLVIDLEDHLHRARRWIDERGDRYAPPLEPGGHVGDKGHLGALAESLREVRLRHPDVDPEGA